MARSPLRVLLFSAGNPEATLLAAGLLGQLPPETITVTLQNVAAPDPSPDVALALAELGLPAPSNLPTLTRGTMPSAVDLAITLCVPT